MHRGLIKIMETPKWHWIVVKRLDSLLHPVKSLYFLCIFSMNRPKTHTINKTMILILLDDGCSNPPCRLSTFQLNWWKTHRVLLKISDSTSHLHTSDGTVLAEIKIHPEGKLHPKNSTVEYWNFGIKNHCTNHKIIITNCLRRPLHSHTF